MSERLAIDGGTPVRDKMLPYGRQSVDQSDIDAVIEVLGSDFLTTGPKVQIMLVQIMQWQFQVAPQHFIRLFLPRV